MSHLGSGSVLTQADILEDLEFIGELPAAAAGLLPSLDSDVFDRWDFGTPGFGINAARKSNIRINLLV